MPMITMAQMQASIKELGAQIRDAANRLAEAAANPATPMNDVTTQQTALKDMNARLTAMQAAYDAQYQTEASALPAPTPGDQQAPGLRDMLKSNEYVRAFAHAICNGVTRKRGRAVPECKVLYDALTIGGGDPAGEDGGFLVPEDIDHQIREITRTLNPLAPLFENENVMSNSGWRVKDAAPTAGMASVDEMGSIQTGEQPVFTKVPYSLTKYGLYIPVSNELATDEIAALFNYLARWFAKKATIQENILLLAALNDLTPTAITSGDELKAIKGVLNKTLDPAIRPTAILLTNQSGFDVLDNLTDAMGRPLLDTDPTTGKPVLRTKQPIVMVADAVLANANSKAPLYIGDLKQYATLFARNSLEIVSTDIGGDAFRTDSIEIRGIKRMGVSKFDEAAVAKRTLVLA